MLWQFSVTLKSHVKIINFMNCIEKFINRNEKVEKMLLLMYEYFCECTIFFRITLGVGVETMLF